MDYTTILNTINDNLVVLIKLLELTCAFVFAKLLLGRRSHL